MCVMKAGGRVICSERERERERGRECRMAYFFITHIRSHVEMLRKDHLLVHFTTKHTVVVKPTMYTQQAVFEEKKTEFLLIYTCSSKPVAITIGLTSLIGW